MAVLQSGFRNLLHHSAIYDWLYHLIPLIDAINRSSSGKVKDIAEFPVQSESQSWSDADGSHSQFAVANPYRWREGERRRERERALTTLCLSYKLQFHSNTKVIATALSEPSFNWSIMNASGVLKELLTFSSWTRGKFIKYFLFWRTLNEMSKLGWRVDNLQLL